MPADKLEDVSSGGQTHRESSTNFWLRPYLVAGTPLGMIASKYAAQRRHTVLQGSSKSECMNLELVAWIKSASEPSYSELAARSFTFVVSHTIGHDTCMQAGLYAV